MQGLIRVRGGFCFQSSNYWAKITNKIRKIKGKLTKEKLKKIFKDEGIDIADDLTTLVDGKIGVDDALAILDLVVGLILIVRSLRLLIN
ncbi:hypothetical protein BSPWISOXPB_2908 [uncultured Gammaproteobacteria bacterium]|nr:hypothetical protein BSPWISOXPB_2908 [uncultured Gammaproteobacteria bacterium]